MGTEYSDECESNVPSFDNPRVDIDQAIAATTLLQAPRQLPVVATWIVAATAPRFAAVQTGSRSTKSSLQGLRSSRQLGHSVIKAATQRPLTREHCPLRLQLAAR